MTQRIHVAFTLFASIVAGVAIVWGFLIVGSPMNRRLERFDERRLEDLRQIAAEVQSIVADSPHKLTALVRPLPKSLDEIVQKGDRKRSLPVDPLTGEPYAYRIVSDTTYELCASFALERKTADRDFWNHSAGRFCFTIDALSPPPFY